MQLLPSIEYFIDWADLLSRTSSNIYGEISTGNNIIYWLNNNADILYV